jgi:hypothetical protein
MQGRPLPEKVLKEYNEVFKTRTKIIDDRPKSRNDNSEPLLRPSSAFSTSSPTSKKKSTVAWQSPGSSPRSGSITMPESRIYPSELDDQDSGSLETTTNFMILPDVEARFLSQYKLDTALIIQLKSQVDALSKKMKQVRTFIRERLEEEQALYSIYAIKIQRWYRGERCRRELRAKGIILPNSRQMRNPDIEHKAAVIIQAIWLYVLIQARLQYSAQNQSSAIFSNNEELL